MAVELFHPRGSEKPLPDVVLLNIFRLLPLKDIVSVRRTCSSWRRISNDSQLWRDIDFRDANITLGGMWQLSRDHFGPPIKSLHLMGRVHKGKFSVTAWKKRQTASSTFMAELVKNCPNIEEFSFTQLSMGNIHFGHLPPNLKRLSCVNTCINRGWFDVLADPTNSQLMSRLTYLDLSGSSRLIDSDIVHIVKLQPPLISLKLNYLRNLSHVAVTAISQNVPQLQIFECSHNNLSGGIMMETLSAHILQLSNLVVLNISYSFLSNYALLRIVNGLPKIEDINIAGCMAMTENVAERLSHSKEVKRIDVSHTPLASDIHVETLTKQWPNCDIVYESPKQPRVPWGKSQQ